MSKKSYWADHASLPKFPRLGKDLKVDVVIVGGGITGVTAAYLLKKEGRTVALVERDRCGGMDTGHTTAHLTHVTDLRLHELEARFGRDHAQATWDAGRAAMQQIDEIVRSEQLLCDLVSVPGYLHAVRGETKERDRKLLQKDAQLAQEMGFEAEYLDDVPFVETAGVRFPNQAKFQPLKYLRGLIESFESDHCHVFEHTEVTVVQDQPLIIKTNGHEIACDYLIVATHVPLMGKAGLVSAALLQSKLASYSSYAVGARVPKRSVPEALFWDTAEPYHYLRLDTHRGHDYLVLGGEDHKTGQEEDPDRCFRNLEDLVATLVPAAEVNSRWSGQVVETNDGLPFIGETSDGQFVATGFSGNGMTFGTLGAMMACDAAMGRNNPWQALFDPSRKKLLGGTWDYIRENLDYPYYMIKDRMSSAETETLQSVKPGDGKILKLKGRRLAVYRDPKGKVTTLSPICTHLGCIVNWNPAESTWECPCHGSKFEAQGKVLAGPAEAPLDRVLLDNDDNIIS
jgi:glycine/D-amino acid oxidase-like deaminating enzyme/nitrite reductase/ring-hydroxylating ferredoxin subunit